MIYSSQTAINGSWYQPVLPIKNMSKIKKVLLIILLYAISITHMQAQTAIDVIKKYNNAVGGYKWGKIKILEKKQVNANTKKKFKAVFNFPNEYRSESDINDKKQYISLITQIATWDRTIVEKDTLSRIFLHNVSYPEELMPDILLADTTLHWEYVGLVQFGQQECIEIRTVYRKISSLSLFFDTKTGFLVRYGDTFNEDKPNKSASYIIFSNYKQIEGFWFPFQTECFINNQSCGKTITTNIVINPVILYNYFAIPAILIHTKKEEMEKLRKETEKE